MSEMIIAGEGAAEAAKTLMPAPVATTEPALAPDGTPVREAGGAATGDSFGDALDQQMSHAFDPSPRGLGMVSGEQVADAGIWPLQALILTPAEIAETADTRLARLRIDAAPEADGVQGLETVGLLSTVGQDPSGPEVSVPLSLTPAAAPVDGAARPSAFPVETLDSDADPRIQGRARPTPGMSSATAPGPGRESTTVSGQPGRSPLQVDGSATPRSGALTDTAPALDLADDMAADPAASRATQRRGDAALAPVGRATPGELEAEAEGEMQVERLDASARLARESADALSSSRPGAQATDARPVAAPASIGAQATPGIAAARPVQVSMSLDSPVTSEAWSEAFGSRVVWMARQDVQQATIRLNPAELGPVSIEVNVTAEQAAVSFGAHQAATREALEQALPRLRELFAESGVELVDVEVHDGGSQHSPGGQAFASDDGRGGARERERTLPGDEAGSGGPARTASLDPASRAGLVDTFA